MSPFNRGTSPQPQSSARDVDTPAQSSHQPQRNVQVGSIYIPPVPAENLAYKSSAPSAAPCYIQQEMQEENNKPRQSTPLRWMASRPNTKESPEWAKEDSITPSSINRPQSMYKPQHNTSNQYQTNNGTFTTTNSYQPTSSPSLAANTGLKLQIQSVGNQPKERIIPIQLEQTPTKTPESPKFSNYSPRAQPSPPSETFVARGPNQFVDQGYNNYMNSQGNANQTRVIPIAVDNNKGEVFFNNSSRGPLSPGPIVIQNNSRGNNATAHTGNTTPNQSKSFRILQKITSTEDGNEDLINEMNQPAELQRPHYSRQMMASNPPKQSNNPAIEQFNRMQINSENGRQGLTMKYPQPPTYVQQRAPFQNDNDQYIPPSQQQAPEPKIYTGSAIPSRSFKLLQAMTTPENAAEMEGSDVEQNLSNDDSFQSLTSSTHFPSQSSFNSRPNSFCSGGTVTPNIIVTASDDDGDHVIELLSHKLNELTNSSSNEINFDTESIDEDNFYIKEISDSDNYSDGSFEHINICQDYQMRSMKSVQNINEEDEDESDIEEIHLEVIHEGLSMITEEDSQFNKSNDSLLSDETIVEDDCTEVTARLPLKFSFNQNYDDSKVTIEVGNSQYEDRNGRSLSITSESSHEATTKEDIEAEEQWQEVDDFWGTANNEELNMERKSNYKKAIQIFSQQNNIIPTTIEQYSVTNLEKTQPIPVTVEKILPNEEEANSKIEEWQEVDDFWGTRNTEEEQEGRKNNYHNAMSFFTTTIENNLKLNPSNIEETELLKNESKNDSKVNEGEGYTNDNEWQAVDDFWGSQDNENDSNVRRNNYKNARSFFASTIDENCIKSETKSKIENISDKDNKLWDSGIRIDNKTKIELSLSNNITDTEKISSLLCDSSPTNQSNSFKNIESNENLTNAPRENEPSSWWDSKLREQETKKEQKTTTSLSTHTNSNTENSANQSNSFKNIESNENITIAPPESEPSSWWDSKLKEQETKEEQKATTSLSTHTNSNTENSAKWWESKPNFPNSFDNIDTKVNIDSPSSTSKSVNEKNNLRWWEYDLSSNTKTESDKISVPEKKLRWWEIKSDNQQISEESVEKIETNEKQNEASRWNSKATEQENLSESFDANKSEMKECNSTKNNKRIFKWWEVENQDSTHVPNNTNLEEEIKFNLNNTSLIENIKDIHLEDKTELHNSLTNIENQIERKPTNWWDSDVDNANLRDEENLSSMKNMPYKMELEENLSNKNESKANNVIYSPLTLKFEVAKTDIDSEKCVVEELKQHTKDPPENNITIPSKSWWETDEGTTHQVENISNKDNTTNDRHEFIDSEVYLNINQENINVEESERHTKDQPEEILTETSKGWWETDENTDDMELTEINTNAESANESWWETADVPSTVEEKSWWEVKCESPIWMNTEEMNIDSVKPFNTPNNIKTESKGEIILRRSPSKTKEELCKRRSWWETRESSVELTQAANKRFSLIENDRKSVPRLEDLIPNRFGTDVKMKSIKERIQMLENSKSSFEEIPDPKTTETERDTLSRNSSQRSELESEVDEDSGVTDMLPDNSSHPISETDDTESENFPELRKMNRYTRATTHSRLFKLLQNENDIEDSVEDEYQFKPSKRKIVHNVSITRRQKPELIKNVESMAQRRERLSLPLRKNTSIDNDNPSTPNSPRSPSISRASSASRFIPKSKEDDNSSAVNEQLVTELIQSLLLKKDGAKLKNLPMEKLQAAAKRVLEEQLDSLENTSIDSTPALTPSQDLNSSDYSDYYDSWRTSIEDSDNTDYDILPSKSFRRLQETSSTGKRLPLARCPRVLSSRNINRDLARVTESPEIIRSSSERDSVSRCHSASRWVKIS